MTYSEILQAFNNLANDYRDYSNMARNPGYQYSERVYYLGLAINSLQQIADLAHQYPGIVARFPRGMLPDYSDQAIFHLFDRQRDLYLERLRELRRNIRGGNYNLNEEMSLKISRLRDTNNIFRSNSTTNVPPGALDARNHALGSVIGTALKYPIRLVSRVLQSGARIIGQVAALPVHLVTYPMSMLINPDSPYQGRTVQQVGENIGNLLATGVRVIENGIMRL